MEILTVNLEKNKYDIIIHHGLIKQIGIKLKELYFGKKVFVVTDENVDRLYGTIVMQSLSDAGFSAGKIVLPAGEKTKDIKNISVIYKSMLAFGLMRDEMLIALGGGVIGDIAGFCASTFLRGVPFIQVPTTLLAQVDSSVGGKVAVDLDEGKNLVGSFYQPKAVLIDPDVLDSLCDAFFYDGLGEVLKYALIGDNVLYSLLWRNTTRADIMRNIETVIFRSCDYKRGIVEQDERDTGKRMLLNFGHTIGHCIEQYYGYEKYSHGQAVVIGMALMTRISEHIGITQPGTAAEVLSFLLAHGLQVQPELPLRTYLGALKHDKKNIGGSLNIVVLEKICSAKVIQAPELFYKAVEEM